MRMPLVSGLEIGSSRTVVGVGELDSMTKRIKVIGLGTYPSIGVRKGLVIDMEKAQACVEAATKNASKKSDVVIWSVIQGCSGSHIRVETNPAVLSIRSPNHVVTKEDIEEINEIARDVQVPSEEQVLHSFPQTYKVDEQPGILRPEGMRCKVLSLNMLTVIGNRNRIENHVNAAKGAELEVTDVVFSGVCAAMAVLTPEQRENGTVVIDLGGGTTDFVVYSHNVIVLARSIAVGGDHVTNDIALAFNIPLNRAEEIKRADGDALVSGVDSKNMRVTVKDGDVFGEARTISRRALQTVINARMDELFRLIRTELDDAGLLPHLGGGIVLTGGGAYLKGVPELAQRIFGVTCRIGVPINVDGLEEVEQPASFATAVGLLIYGYKSYDYTKNTSSFTSMIRGWFGK